MPKGIQAMTKPKIVTPALPAFAGMTESGFYLKQTHTASEKTTSPYVYKYSRYVNFLSPPPALLNFFQNTGNFLLT